MNQKRIFCLIFIVILGVLSSQSLMAQTIKVDAGHHPGSIVNDGKFSPIFTYDQSLMIDSQSSGQTSIQLDADQMFHLSKFQVDTYPIDFRITDSSDTDEEILDIERFRHSTNAIVLASPLQHSYSVNSRITFDFEVQAYGCQNSSGHWVDIQYNYDMEGGTWDDDSHCSIPGGSYEAIEHGGDRVGLVEYVENWKVAEQIVNQLSNASHTRSGLEATKSIYQRGQDILQANADLFVSVHFNAFNQKADDSRIYPLHRTEYNQAEWYTSYNASNNTVSGEAPQIQGTYNLTKGDTFYAKITPANPDHCTGLGTNGCHIRPWPLRTRVTDAGDSELISNRLIPESQVSKEVTYIGVDDAAGTEIFTFHVPTAAQDGLATLDIRGPHHTTYEDDFADSLVAELGNVNNIDTGYGGSQLKPGFHWGITRFASDLQAGTEAVGSLDELLFYDDPESARWLYKRGNTDHYDTLANAVVTSINSASFPSSPDDAFDNLASPNSSFNFSIGDSVTLHGQTTNVATGRGKGDFQMTFTEQSMNLTYDTASGAYGDYSIDLPAGDYEVSLTFPDTEVGSSQVDFYDTQYQVTVPSPDTLGDSPEMERNFKVKPYAGVKGYVSDAWTGKLVDGAEVTLKDTAGNVIKTYPSTGESYAPDGYYILQRFPGGTYDMRAEKQNVGFDTEAGLSLSRNQITSVDFQLVAAYPHFYGTVKRARDGKKLGDVTVEATPQFSGGTTSWTGQTISAEDKTGRYKTDKLDDGQYKLSFSKTNYRDSSVTISTLPDTGKVVDKLLKAKPVPLQVEVEDYISGSPIDNARVRWEHETLSDSGGGFTNSSGEYQQNQVPWGKYKLTVSKPGYDTVTLPLDLPVGSSKTKLVRLKELADLKVFVREYGSDTPVGAADVSIREYAHPNRSKTTNSSGRVEFTQIAPVQWKIVGNKSGFEVNAVQVSVTPGDTVWDTVPLRPYGSVQGDVKDPDGNPLDNVTVKAFRNGSLKKEITSSSGHYSISNVGIGSYTLEFSKQNYKSKSVDNVQVTKPGNTKNLTLKHLGIVKGTVIDDSNNDPIEDAEVKITGTPEGTIGPVSTDDDGEYKFAGVPTSSDVSVVVSHPVYGSRSKPLSSIQLEQTYTVDFQLTPKNGYLDGKITSTCGGGVYHVDLEVYQSGVLVEKRTDATSSSGDFSDIKLQDGSYSLEVKDDDYVDDSRNVEVEAAQTTYVEMSLEPYDREIKVHVTKEGGDTGAQKVPVTVEGGGISKTLKTGWGNNSGERVFYNLLPGYTYSVLVDNGSSGSVTLDCSSVRQNIDLIYYD